MGRTGVTLQEVEKAALQLQGRGKNPSVDAVREVLGTGSKSTIAQHLRDWKSQQSQTQGKLPPDLLALVTGLWEQLNLQADQRIIEAEHASTQELLKLKQALTCLHQDYAHLKDQCHQSEESLITERSGKESLQKQLHVVAENHVKLQERYQAISQQIDDYKSENVRLHKLANNVQANFEHYQNAMQQVRTEQTLINEKQQTQFQQEIADLKSDLSLSQVQSKDIDQQLKHKMLELQQLEKQYHSLQESYEKLAQQSHKYDHELALFQARCEQYLQTINNHETEIEKKNQNILALEKQIAVSAEQVNSLQKNLNLTEDKIEILRHEKLFLAQEKSELQGHLKQLEKKGNSYV